MEPSVWSLVPPLLAIGLALATRQVYLSLGLGIFAGFLILAGGNPVAAFGDTLEGLVAVVGEAGNARIILFTFAVGALIRLVQVNGGVAGFGDAVLRRLKNLEGRAARVRVELMALATGLVLFIESNISILTAGTLFRPLTDRLGVPREKLAWIADSGSAPSSVLIPFNAWGAYVAGLLALQGVDGGFGVVLGSVVFNLYALAVLAILIAVIVSGRNFGPMRTAERRGTLLRDGARPMLSDDLAGAEPAPGAPRRAADMLVPVAVMVLGVPLLLVATGEGTGVLERLQSGSGSRAVLYSVTLAAGVALLLARLRGSLGVRAGIDEALRGAGAMFPLALLMALAFALGSLAREMGTGPYVVALVEGWLSPALLPALVFVLGAVVSFSTGTSWGTFAILVPIAVPLAQGYGIPLPLAVAAVLGGGVFGDHASPISDTSVVSSMAAGSDHIDHVRTQLPYALAAGGVAVAGYLVLGALTAR